MTGLTPVPFVALNSCTAPAIEPWSVSETAGISNSAACLASSGMRHAPSRIEYSEWTCRWTKGASGMQRPPYRRVLTGPFRRSGKQFDAVVKSDEILVEGDERRLRGDGEGEVAGVV